MKMRRNCIGGGVGDIDVEAWLSYDPCRVEMS
jgi:hypothetical protein